MIMKREGAISNPKREQRTLPAVMVLGRLMGARSNRCNQQVWFGPRHISEGTTLDVPGPTRGTALLQARLARTGASTKDLCKAIQGGARSSHSQWHDFRRSLGSLKDLEVVAMIFLSQYQAKARRMKYIRQYFGDPVTSTSPSS